MENNKIFTLTEEQKFRYNAFWERKDSGRACLFIKAWDGAERYPAPETLYDQWENVPRRIDQAQYETEHSLFFAEAYPSIFVNFGPGSLTPGIGGTHKLSPYTVWFENEPFVIEDWENVPELSLHPDSKMYRMIEEMTAGLLAHKDRMITSISDIGGTMDIVAALRGSENLLYDLYDYPEEVKAFVKKLEVLWRTFFLTYSARLIKEQGCMTSWQPVWSDKSFYPLQCDFCAMLSPEMFGEFVLPDLRFQTEFMDRAIYHLDGPGELPHVDQLLSLPRLNAIQWTSGDGNPPLEDPCWYDLYARIQAAGKGIILLGISPEGFEKLVPHIRRTGLFVTMDVKDEQEAKEIIRMAEKMKA